MLESHLTDLIVLRENANNEVDALIKLTAEIAETQSKIESLRGEHEYLRLRTDLDVIHINYVVETSRSFLSPIGRSISEFLDDLSEGIAQAITGLAYLLPWLIILVPLSLGFRKLWKRKK